MSSRVEDVLQSINRNETNFKSTEVNKALDVEIDEGNLLVVDSNEIDLNKLRFLNDNIINSILFNSYCNFL